VVTTWPPFPRQPGLELRLRHHRTPAPPSLLDLPHRLLLGSGRSAIRLALTLAGVRASDEVLVPTYHCPTMIAPVETLGAKPCFYPLDDAGLPDLQYLDQLDTRRARALLAPHLFGVARPMQPVADFCRHRGLSLLEDCAHCFCGEFSGAAIGTVGDFAIGSLPKFFPVATGGLLASRRTLPAPPAHGDFAQELRSAWSVLELARQPRHGGTLRWIARLLGAAHRSLSGSAAAIEPPAITQLSPERVRTEALADPWLQIRSLPRVESCVVLRADISAIATRRAANFRALQNALEACSGLRPLPLQCHSGDAPYVVPVLLDDVTMADETYANMRRRRLPVYRWDQLWPRTPALSGDPAWDWSRRLIQVTCHQSHWPEDMPELAQALRNCLPGGSHHYRTVV